MIFQLHNAAPSIYLFRNLQFVTIIHLQYQRVAKRGQKITNTPTTRKNNLLRPVCCLNQTTCNQS